MILFWFIVALLVLAALITLLRPLLRAPAENGDASEASIAIFRRQFTQIDTEAAQGRLSADEAAGARVEITRRMLASADQQAHDPAPNRSPDMSWRIAAMIGITALLPAAALAVYSAVGSPAILDPSGAAVASEARAGLHDKAELAAAADQLKTRLEREPGHVEGWILLGRTFTSLGRFAEAREAYNRALALIPDEPGLHAELGELIVLTAGGTVTSEAEAEFAKAGNDPRARFYRAEAALQRGDREGATAGLKALLADAPAEAPWRKAVEERLAEIAPGEPPAAPLASPGPTAKDVAAAQSMSPEERQAMIRGMVERLAARLQQNPNDKEGWIRLAHAYDVLGDAEKATAARARAAAAPSGN
jgi:cytochrome c-type biogenesis protein CcmH